MAADANLLTASSADILRHCPRSSNQGRTIPVVGPSSCHRLRPNLGQAARLDQQKHPRGQTSGLHRRDQLCWRNDAATIPARFLPDPICVRYAAQAENINLRERVTLVRCSSTQIGRFSTP